MLRFRFGRIVVPQSEIMKTSWKKTTGEDLALKQIDYILVRFVSPKKVSKKVIFNVDLTALAVNLLA